MELPIPCRAARPPHIPAQGGERACGSPNTKLVCISLPLLLHFPLPTASFLPVLPWLIPSHPEIPSSGILSLLSKPQSHLQL